MQLYYIAISVFYYFIAANDISIFESNFTTGDQTAEALDWLFHEVTFFNIYFTGEGDFPFTASLSSWIVLCQHSLGLAFWIIGDDDL